jgi:hypothetical protein
MHRARTIATLIAVLALSACSAREEATPAPSPSPTAPAEMVFQPPSNPCDAVSAATREQYELTRPKADTFPYTGAETAGGDMILADTIRCSWAVDNPGKGPNGRKNQFSVTLDLQVPTTQDADEISAMAQAASKHDVTPTQMAQALLDSGQADLEGESAGVASKLKRNVPINDLGDRAYSAVLAQEDVSGRSTAVVVALQAANAHIKVTVSGSDLKIDPSLPEGLQLVTTPVPPRRLKPAAEAIAHDALDALPQSASGSSSR